MLKMKHLAIALAAGALVAVLGAPDIADARGGGGGHGGGGFGGGHGFGGSHFGGMGMGGMGRVGGMGGHFGGMRGGFSHPGMGFRGASHGFSPSAGHIASRSFNRGFLQHRGLATGAAAGLAGAHLGHALGQQHLRATKPTWATRISITSLRTSLSIRPRSFSTTRSHQYNNFNHNHNWNGNWGWRDHWGHWWGYRWGGGVFWPYAFGDYFSYAFWPYDYYDTFWGYGPDAIMWGAFWPYGEFSYDGGYGNGSAYNGDIYRPYRRHAPAATAAADPAATAGTCTGFAPGVNDLPIQQLEKLVDESEEQRAALNELKAATVKASDILKQSCTSEKPLTPPSRLDAMQRRLQAMADANDVVKGPLERLYGLLSDAQKHRLEALAQPNVKRADSDRAKDVNIGELCTSQAAFTNVPAEQIASTIQLTDAQKEELEKLKTVSAQASDGLKAGCPAAVPDTLDGRLDAAQQRLTALITAVDTVRPAVRDFYATLTDEQKAALSVQPAEMQAANRG